MAPGRKGDSASSRPGGHMVGLKKNVRVKSGRGTPEDPGRYSRTKFGVFGEEMIEKQVKPSGNSGRVYLPLNWVGKHVKIIRID
jgi:hypothetical protein